jgi:hypothetical protein
MQIGEQMGILDSVLMFFDGVKSAIGNSGIIQNIISESLSNGIETGFNKVKKSIEQTVIKISLIIISIFLMVWGLSTFIDNFVAYHGLGYVIVGAVFGLITLIYFWKT